MAKDVPQPVSHICFIGAGYVGGPTAAIIANQCPHIQVTVVDRDAGRIDAWQSDTLPISEKGLLEIVQETRDGAEKSRRPNLHFTTQLERSIQQADVIMVSVDTPTKRGGTGSGYCADTGRLKEVVRAIAEYAKSNKIVVEKSTVPVGTGETIRGILNANARNGVAFEVLSNPEFLAEGTAVADLLCPDRILIGSPETSSGYAAAEALADVYAGWVPRSRIITMNLFSSELSKLAANAMLAQRISNMNALSVLCEATGARVEEISQAVGSDTRIGPHMLNSSFGFGGSCFKKDIRSLVYLCRCLGLDGVAAYWDAILDINEHQKSRTITRIASKLQDGLRQKRVAVLGFAFKPETGDTRESCAIDLVRGLLHQGASVTIYDPCVTDNQIYEDLGSDAHSPNLGICNSGEEACEGVNAILVATNWELFSTKPEGNPKQTTYFNVNFTQKSYATDSTETLVEMMEDRERSPSEASETSTSSTISFSGAENNSSYTEIGAITVGIQPRNRKDSSDGIVQQRRLDWEYVSQVMVHPKLVVGSSECLDAETLDALGFSVEIIGRKSTE